MVRPKSYNPPASPDWHAEPNQDPSSKLHRIISHNDTRQRKTLLSMTEKKIEGIPNDGAFTNIYCYKKGNWVFMGYRCLHCDKVMRDDDIVQKHHIICVKTLKINREAEESMPIQRVEKNGEVYYRYGQSGKLYKNRKDAEKQAQAIHASGYQEPSTAHLGRPQVAPKVKKK